MRRSTQITANIGLYYACYKLSMLGWNAMPTARNARGIDIVAYNYDCSKMIRIQVKTLSGRAPVPLGNFKDKINRDFWIIVNNVSKKPRTYILYPKEVEESAHESEKDGEKSYWLEPKSYEKEEFREAWERIGDGNKST